MVHALLGPPLIITELSNNLTISDAKMAVERNSKGVYLMLRNKITNNRLSLLLDEGTKKLVLDSEISGEWTGADPIITKSDLDKVAKIDRSTSSAWVGDKDRNMIFNCNFNSKTLIVTFADGKTVTFQGQ